MVEKPFEWADGATLEEHSKRKHKILREYFSRYLSVRCQLPQQERFRLAIVEGFAGGGRYKCGAPGSPLIFVEELKAFINEANVRRASEGMKALQMECLLILNDANKDAIELLKANLAPALVDAKETATQLHIRVIYYNHPFETAYILIKDALRLGRYRNVLFNLDQCGHSHVERATLVDMVRTYQGAEIFYTFAIKSLITYLRAADPTAFASQLARQNLTETDLKSLEGTMSKQTWLGAAEKLVFNAFRSCADYVSPFSINNPDGWRYWLIHFANSYRARQEYNDILHANSTIQAHYGRSGLNMLSYDPTHEKGTLYLFDLSGRDAAREQLMEDIPRVVSEFGDAIPVGGFYESIYNATPAHMDDIHAAIMENGDLEVTTENGGHRRKANTIAVGDILRLKNQRTLFPMFPRVAKPRGT